MFQELRLGIKEKRMVKMVYQNSQQDIRYCRVDPYKMTDKKLYGYCHLRGQEMIFNLENVLSVQLTDKNYTIHTD
ncbi:WYL domain-containing protein [Sporohalobacter salinus]|uniref:WYL domain-containing protein n=1 Tax=Sporohalobacter salinus TaxID=1494606 RepID=UPI00196043F6|nr:WYL domain-containing protein [Sporohalobacter salinus]MBM7624805.1 putative DNA-binding transcriptional regulator YafY [Sporohalobacter salinus]